MKCLITILMLVVLFAVGCVKAPPASFSSVIPAGWASVEIRDNVDYDHAWKAVWSVLYRDFDIEFASKDDGYIRTSWLYTWSGQYEDFYRVRVTAKFDDNRKTLNVKAEAQALIGEVWVLGVDSRLVSTLKTDIMGTIGRTTR